MNQTGKQKILILLIVVLLVSNLGMLWYFTRDTKPAKPKSRTERMADWIKKELQLDDNQTQQYIALRNRRDSLLKPLQMDMRSARMEMLELLRRQNVPDSQVVAAAHKIGAMQVPIEMEFYNHFRRIQAICQTNQLPLFDTLLINMVKRNTGDTTQPARPSSRSRQ